MLRGAGATVGAVLGLAGTAAASDFEAGDCAVTTYRSAGYETACQAGTLERSLDGGVTGQVLDTCTASDGGEWAYFSPGTTIHPAYWVRETNLAHCRRPPPGHPAKNSLRIS